MFIFFVSRWSGLRTWVLLGLYWTNTHAPPISVVSPVLISWRSICLRGQSDSSGLHRPFPPPLSPTQAVRPAQGSYSVTFASSPMFAEMWSRFPYCARVVEQALRRASVPSEAGPDYVDWFRVCSHCFLIPGEGPAAAFGVADNRVEYVSVSNYLFHFYVS